MSVRIDSTLLQEILEKTPATQNIMLMGKHGIGKSQILEKFYSQKGYKVVTLFLGQMSDPGDLIGIPHKNEKTGHTEFMPPYWFPTDNTPVVLFLDELNRARPEVLQTIMDLALNRKLAGRSLPEGSRIISAVNNGEEYQLTDLDPALVSRFNIYEFCPSVEEWVLWAQKNEIDKRITDFIIANPELLDNHKAVEDIDSLEKTPDRRGWQKVSEIIKNVSNLNNVYLKMTAGIVGPATAKSFFEFLSENHLLTAEELLLAESFFTSLVKLRNYDTAEFATLNDGIFVFLESRKYKPASIDLIKNNFISYYNYLEENGLREAMAHFANLFSSTSYPNALVFILENCSNLYSRMTAFVQEIR